VPNFIWLRSVARARHSRHKAPAEYEIRRHPALVGTSYALATVLEDSEKVAPFSRTNVLVRGETGTGKELVASALPQRRAS